MEVSFPTLIIPNPKKEITHSRPENFRNFDREWSPVSGSGRDGLNWESSTGLPSVTLVMTSLVLSCKSFLIAKEHTQNSAYNKLDYCIVGK